MLSPLRSISPRHRTCTRGRHADADGIFTIAQLLCLLGWCACMEDTAAQIQLTRSSLWLVCSVAPHLLWQRAEKRAFWQNKVVELSLVTVLTLGVHIRTMRSITSRSLRSWRPKWPLASTWKQAICSLSQSIAKTTWSLLVKLDALVLLFTESASA